MKINKLLLSWSWREIRVGQLWPVLVALTLIIACVVALSTLALRVDNIMQAQGRALLAADLVLKSSNPLQDEQLQAAKQWPVTLSTQSRFQTMAFSDDNMLLVTVKSVQSNYPLRGELTLIDAQGRTQQHVKPGELWVSERLLGMLNSEIGDVIAIGDAERHITGVVTNEPELLFNPFNSIPHLFMHQADLASTGAVQQGSRVRHRLFVNGEPEDLSTLQAHLTLSSGQAWLDQNRQGRTASLLVKAKQYLSLSILMVLLMAAVTLTLTCLHYARNRSESVSMLKSMGASRRWVRNWLLLQLSLLFVIAFVIGASLGVALEYLLRLPLHDILPAELPAVGVKPYLFALAVALCIGLPALMIPLMRLLETPAINVIQQQRVPNNYKRWWLLLLPVTALALFYGANKLVWMLLFGLIMLFVLLALLSFGLLQLFAKGRWSAPLTLALSRIKRSSAKSLMQLGALSGSLMLVALIWLIKSDLLGDWQQTMSADAPNVFAFNISPTQRDGYLQQVDRLALPRSDAFAIIRGRITHINEKTAAQHVGDKHEQINVLRREINFTWADTLPVYNEVLAGQWGAPQSVSVEQKVARDLNIDLGDELTFNVNSRVVRARVNSIRAVKWQSMKPNFVFIFSEDVIAELPATWMLSFRVGEQQTQVINALARDHATVSLLDLRSMGKKIQALLRQVAWSLTGLAGLGVVSGILLIFTLLRLSLHERRREISLYRTLGASKKRIANTLWAEYGLLALTAGVVAAFAAQLLLYSLMRWGFALPTQWHPMLWLSLPFLALMIVYITLVGVIKGLLTPLR